MCILPLLKFSAFCKPSCYSPAPKKRNAASKSEFVCAPLWACLLLDAPFAICHHRTLGGVRIGWRARCATCHHPTHSQRQGARPAQHNYVVSTHTGLLLSPGKKCCWLLPPQNNYAVIFVENQSRLHLGLEVCHHNGCVWGWHKLLVPLRISRCPFYLHCARLRLLR